MNRAGPGTRSRPATWPLALSPYPKVAVQMWRDSGGSARGVLIRRRQGEVN